VKQNGYEQRINDFKKNVLYNNQNGYINGIDYKEIRVQDYEDSTGEKIPVEFYRKRT